MRFPEEFREVTFEARLGDWTVTAAEMPRGWVGRSTWRWALRGPDHLEHFNCGLDLALARLWARANGHDAYAGAWGHEPWLDIGGAFISVDDYPAARAFMDDTRTAAWAQHVRACRRMTGDPNECPLPSLPEPCDSWLYLISSRGKLKIGFTATTPERRLASLQTGSPYKLRLASCCRGTRADEKVLHRLFRPWRTKGEWFEDRREIWQAFLLLASDPTRAQVPHPEEDDR